ncbi:MAG: LamG domain-containing protein [Labilithrix sp.]|nr:LamG domain-containing protein [Labilithrix sp.]
MRLRFDLVLAGLAAACAVACSILVDSTGFTGADANEGDAGPPRDAAEEAASIDAGEDASDGAPEVHPYVQAVLADGPSLYYRLEETSDGPAKDEAGNHQGNYIAGGVHAVPGAFAGSTAYHLVGGTGGIDPGDIFDFEGNAAFTLEAWFRPEGYDTQYRFLVHHNDARALRQNYGIYVHSESGLVFERYVDDSGRGAYTTNPTIGSWYHIVGVYDGAFIRLYVDGTLVNTGADNRSAKDKRSNLMIGYGYNGGGAVIGVLDEVAIYEKALDASRITAHYRAVR